MVTFRGKPAYMLVYAWIFFLLIITVLLWEAIDKSGYAYVYPSSCHWRCISDMYVYVAFCE